ncbi:coiled-coil domain-containing protein 22 homolog isoform X2 [Portunus trituberculatus]|uniref:coiled-coil domain-containing protein 22 homolog isoform X2 n=1 Tax=Portunus trituberculatus TaxID=210409 RepID=UPI001E1CB576|nr:coiled-coil domain-containing protein 22 homolog isoform X2 [Portunus trituberculatus]
MWYTNTPLMPPLPIMALHTHKGSYPSNSEAMRTHHNLKQRWCSSSTTHCCIIHRCLCSSRRFICVRHWKCCGSISICTEMKNYYGNHLRRVTELVGYNCLLATLLNTHAAQLEREKFISSCDNTKDNNEKMKLQPLMSERDIPATVHSTHSADLDILPIQATSIKSGVQGQDMKSMEEKNTDQKAAARIEESAAKSREECLTNLEKEVANIKSKISECTQGMKDAQDTLAKLTDEIAREEELTKEKSKDIKTMQRTSSLLPDSDVNIQKLKAALKNSEEKMGRLQQQWNAHREPLSEQLAHLTMEMEDKKKNKEKILENIGSLRDKMKAMVQEASRKESAEAQLKEQVEKITKDVNRSVYTKRIIDISAKVRKQKQEIDRVLADTRTIQKEINILSGKLERTFTVVEGTAYKEAANNERVRQVYRAVAAVHEGCGELVDIVRETGATQREISDLREQVDLEKTKNVEEKLEQLRVDLNQVKKENASLKKQIV